MLAIFMMTGTSAHAQLFRKADKMKQETKQEMRAGFLKRSEQAAAKRIQPSQSQMYDNNDRALEQLKYDAQGNITEVKYAEEGVTQFIVYQYDNSKGYPILLNLYNYIKPDGGEASEPSYSLRTTVDANNIRTAIESSNYKSIVLDAAGHVIKTERDYGHSDGSETEKQEITWNGDQIASYKYDYVTEDEETHIDLKNIEIVYAARPFNAYAIDYSDLTNFDESGVVINASGTTTMMEGGETFSAAMTITSEVSTGTDKIITTTVMLDDEPMTLQKITYTDSNGSYSVLIDNQDGEKEEFIVEFNEYGDLTKAQELNYEENAIVYSETNRYEWTYDNGKPTEVKRYIQSDEDEESLQSKEVFTGWYDGTSIQNIYTGDIRILGASLYTLNGTLVRTLTPEELQATTLDAPQNGVYLLKINTDQGIEVRKVVITQ